MSKKRIVQIIAIVFLVIAVILLIPNTKWTENTSVWGFISLVFGTLGSIISIFIPTTYTFSFLESDWHKTMRVMISVCLSQQRNMDLAIHHKFRHF